MAKDPKSEPFVSQQDRPNITADTPLSDLRVRDLHQVLAGGAQLKVTDKSFIVDKHHKEIEKFHPDKLVTKDIIKDADNKHLKDIIDQIIVKTVPESPPDPRTVGGGDPFERIHNSIEKLTNEVTELKAKIK